MTARAGEYTSSTWRGTFKLLVKRRSSHGILRANYARWRAAGSPPLRDDLGHCLGLQVRGVLAASECKELASIVKRAKSDWTSDFDGEQYSLGSAFYTHLETGKSRDYFEDAADSDRRVEKHLPGLQARMRNLLAELLAVTVRPRYGFCGAGVHVFPKTAAVAKRGGVVHYDVEGLAPSHLAAKQATATLVLMLQPAAFGGGLRVYRVKYTGCEVPSDHELESAFETVKYEAGDAFLMESTRLHQIRPFRGPRDRISVTLHSVEVDAVTGVWESWF